MTQEDIYYEAILTRDSRFDGKFFAGSTTTWIYCRPVCPAKPKRENVRFFKSAIEAERAGYRPCLRCCPESAPGTAAVGSTNDTINRGLRILTSSEFYNYDENKFASLLGLSSRHLRRLFKEELGKTAKQIADDNRLDFARKLIIETGLPITKIAYSSGFFSVRRFNDSVMKRFKRSPSAMRRSNKTYPNNKKGITLELSYRPPFLWDDHLRFYRVHQILGVEEVNDKSYSRCFNNYGTLGQIKISHAKNKNALSVTVVAEDMQCLYPLMKNIRQMFDLNADPVVIANSLEKSKRISKMVKKYPGLRLSRFWDPFEGAVCTILGQLVSLSQARRTIEKLVDQYGQTITNPESGEHTKLFPTALVLSKARMDNIGTTKIRAGAINKFSQMVINNELNISVGREYQFLRDKLLSIKGVGPWTADYIALRAMGEPDAFPGEDLILKRALTKYQDVKPEEHAPYRSYLAAYLWHEHIKSSK